MLLRVETTVEQRQLQVVPDESLIVPSAVGSDSDSCEMVTHPLDQDPANCGLRRTGKISRLSNRFQTRPG